MNRLQKKCLIATAGLHLTLVLVIVFGAAFFTEHSNPEDTTLLTVIPITTIDEVFSSGVAGAKPPPPTPVVKPPEPQAQPTPTPPQPKPVITPPPPTPVPAPTLMDKVKDLFTPEPKKLQPEDLKPVEPADKPTKPKHEIKVDLTKPIVRNTPKAAEDTSAADDAREAKKLRDQRLKAIANAARSIKDNASTATTVEMPGTGSVSYANYASVVKSIYERAWTPPDDTASDDAITKASVTIASDGTVISTRILNPSGDTKVDASVQRTLDRVTFIAPFPDGSKEKQKNFIINFNLKAKRMLG